MGTLVDFTAERIKDDLRSGKLDASGRLPGYRVLGERYSVSGGTARKALEQLESAAVLHRRDRSGTYVSPVFLKNFEQTRVLTLVFPEKSISRERLAAENYAINMEIFQGLVQEAGALNGRVEFQHMPETNDRVLLDQQLCQLKDSDGVVMIGWQLQPLRERLFAAGIPVLAIGSYHEMTRGPGPYLSRSLARTVDVLTAYINGAGYRRLVLVYKNNPRDPSEDHKARALAERGLFIEGVYPWGDGALLALMKERRDERVFFPLNTDIIPEIYHYAYREGLHIGRDLDLFALASGFSFANYFPPLSYFRIPYFEQGRVAARVLLDPAFDGETALDPVYVQGETSRKAENRLVDSHAS